MAAPFFLQALGITVQCHLVLSIRYKCPVSLRHQAINQKPSKLQQLQVT